MLWTVKEHTVIFSIQATAVFKAHPDHVWDSRSIKGTTVQAVNVTDKTETGRREKKKKKITENRKLDLDVGRNLHTLTVKKTQTTKASKHISTYCSFAVHVKGTITTNPDKSDSVSQRKSAKMASLDKGACALTSEVDQNRKSSQNRRLL